MQFVTSKIFPMDQGRHRITVAGALRSSSETCIALMLLCGQGEARFRNAPDSRAHLLRRVGEAIDIEVAGAVNLMVSMIAPTRDSVAETEVVIEALDEAEAARQPAGQTPRQGVGTGLALVAHVQNLGERRFEAGSLIAGATGGERIEGISIDWPACPGDLTLNYRAALQNGERTEWVGLGHFAGTRGKQLAMTSLSLALSGAAAAAWSLSAEAIFAGPSGSRTQHRAEGQTIVLAGGTGRESLVGLRLAIAEITRSTTVTIVPKPVAADAPQRAPAARPTAKEPPQVEPRAAMSPKLRRVKMFRAPPHA